MAGVFNRHNGRTVLYVSVLCQLWRIKLAGSNFGVNHTGRCSHALGRRYLLEPNSLYAAAQYALDRRNARRRFDLVRWHTDDNSRHHNRRFRAFAVFAADSLGSSQIVFTESVL